MMLLTLRDVSLRLGNTVLLDKAGFTIEKGERVCLIGRNGMGKSTLLKLIAGEQKPDDGEIVRAQNLKVATLVQDVPTTISGTVYDVVALGLGATGRLVAEYHHLLEQPDPDLKKLGRLQDQMDAQDGWTLESRVQETVSRLELPGEADFASLSGGLKRRVLLAQALVSQPDLLLLDEPTNHLDIASIAWLEEFFKAWDGAILFVTHDRAFLRNLATRILELDRGWLTSWPGDYDNYLRRREERLHAETQERALFDKRLAQEEKWIRKGIEARRTRDMGRVKRLMEMRQVYSERRNQPGQARMLVQEAERSGKLVAEAENVSYTYPGALAPTIRGLTATVLRGDKLGIIGPNGVGKTTLINLLLGKLAPTSGTLKLGSKLEVAYFDQLRGALKEELPVIDNVAEGKDYVQIGEQRKHVMGYLQEFLFTPDRARSPVKSLSGGERNRLMLAKLFAKPSNLMVLDEPTNDLDVETLELLEELISDYSGTVLVVSHDRAFLNNVIGRCLVFEGEGRVNEYIGGYDDWLRQRPAQAAVSPARKPAPVPVMPAAPAPLPMSASRLSGQDKRELDGLPKKIDKLEAEQTQLTAQLSDPGFFQQDKARAVAVQQRLAAVSAELAAAYSRWEELEALRGR
ncbi:MAG: ATP-binding cassette domain-containing protein [Nevskiaceae bacterium]|nr:MAG: ATP-binding cassette domain-containing protein [Nevskiaceae bacterium]